jgi:hypothetical protein
MKNEGRTLIPGKPVASSSGTRIQAKTNTNILEAIMTQANHPSKYAVREYLERRSQEVKPPPSPEEIRRQLGWGLMMFDQKMESSSRG